MDLGVGLEIEVEQFEHGDVVEGDEVSDAGLGLTDEFEVFQVELLEISKSCLYDLVGELGVESGVSKADQWGEKGVEDQV